MNPTVKKTNPQPIDAMVSPSGEYAQRPHSQHLQFEPTLVRRDFPILSRVIDGKPLVYLDNAATSQRPKRVVDAMTQYYFEMNANVHRGVYKLSQESTSAFEAVRGKVARFLGGVSEREIVFTGGTTAAVNLMAYGLGEILIREGDVIAVTRMEHHANFVPWQQLAKRKKARFEIIELDADFKLDPESVNRVLALKPKILAITAMSNVTGVINPIASLAARFSLVGTRVLVDGAQWVAHTESFLNRLGPIDAFYFSAHKICGPTGVGVLWAKSELLEAMPPWITGGSMIVHVGDHDSDWNEIPFKFEAGTPDIAGVIGLGAAIDYLETLGRVRLESYETWLTETVLDRIRSISGLRLVGPWSALSRGAIFSVAIEGVHAHDLASYFDLQGISVRAGHHCAHPLMAKLGMPATCRASFSFYNTAQEAEKFCEALSGAKLFFARGRAKS